MRACCRTRCKTELTVSDLCLQAGFGAGAQENQLPKALRLCTTIRLLGHIPGKAFGYLEAFIRQRSAEECEYTAGKYSQISSDDAAAVAAAHPGVAPPACAELVSTSISCMLQPL